MSHPVIKEMDPVHSGTGIFYQAIPAVGTDGKNIMKLIPVKVVNGHFQTSNLKSQTSRLRPDATAQRALTSNTASAPVQMVKMAVVKTSATTQIVRKPVSLTSAFPNQVGLELGNSLNKHPLQQQNANLMAIIPQMLTPAVYSGNPGRPSQLSVTVNSPTLSRGQYLQIPPNAQVTTVPASEFPPGIKKQIFTLPASSSPSSGLPSVVYVPPTASVNVGFKPQNDSALDKLKMLCNIANKTSCEGSTFIPKDSQNPNSPMKWVIEEGSPAAPAIDPIRSSVTSEILRVVAQREIVGKHSDVIPKAGQTLNPIGSSVVSEILQVTAKRENSGKHCDVNTKAVFGLSQGRSGQGQEKALVECNGTHQLQQQKSPMATPAANSGTLGRAPSQLPVTVNFPTLTRGQYLQSPPNAQTVRTVPTSDLPPGIKKQILTSVVNSVSSSSATYVSPITSVNVGHIQNDSSLGLHKLPCNITDQISSEPPTKGPKPHLKLIPTVPQRPDSPIKWAIEEEDNSAAPSLDPIGSSVTSEVLRVVAQREIAGKHRDTITKPVSGSSPGKSGQGQENSLVMCKGKMFFEAKKSQKPLESAPSKKRSDLKIVILDKSDEVIDLCDDETHDDSSQQAASVHMSAATHPDEDNVIFVSYIPPKSESESTQALTLKHPISPVKETKRMGSSNETEQKNLDGTTGSPRRGNPDQNLSISMVTTLTHASGSAVMVMHEDSNISSQQNTSTKQLENMDVETRSPADPRTSDGSSGICSRLEKDTLNMESSMNPTASWTSSPAPPLSDNLLRQMFGITADVKICLQRIDDASVWSLPVEPPESVEEPTSELKDEFSQETDSCDVERAEAPAEQELSGHSDIKCSHFKLNTEHLSVLTNKHHLGNKGTCSDVETEPVTSYVEPIEEDFLSADENDIHSLPDTAARTQTCADVDTNTRRMGRKRKRTTCPCCISGAQYPAVTSEESDQSAWTTGKKGGRTKAVRKDVKTSGRISCLSAKSKHISEDAASDGLSSTSTDSDELKLHEQIIRLKELLQQKEAALELMRNSSS